MVNIYDTERKKKLVFLQKMLISPKKKLINSRLKKPFIKS